MQFEKVVFSDSNIVLTRIRNQARESKPFVSARVAEIQSNSDPSQWRHVAEEFIVADDVSCGIPAQRLIGRWKQGPEFLRLPEEEWPKENSTADLNEVEKEYRKTQAILLTGSPEVIDCKKFSNWRKLVRTSAYVFRFIWNLHTRCQAKKLPDTPEQQMQVSHGLLVPQEPHAPWTSHLNGAIRTVQRNQEPTAQSQIRTEDSAPLLETLDLRRVPVVGHQKEVEC